MKKLLTVFLFAGFLAALHAQEDGRTLRRIALLVGSNSGGKGRSELKYAEKDARAFSAVMRELGGLDPRHERILYSPDRSALLREFANLRNLPAESKKTVARTEFLFYYSGHSDDEGILLGNEKVLYADLKNLIGSMKAEVEVVILDSCSSGAITRLKGGTRSQPFLVDESSSMSGHAYLTSSSEFEATQESDKIRGSYFTYYLVTGLRGAADTSGDGKVTLNEAYSHAFAETLARTEYTKAGPQHPSYNIKLTGSGDLVLTDVRSAETKIVFEEAIKGRISIRDEQEHLVAETLKKADKSMEFSLPSGVYSITLLSGERLLRTQVNLERNTTTRLGIALFSPVGRESASARGKEEDESPVLMKPFSLSIFSFDKEIDEMRIGHEWAFNLIGGKSYEISGAQMSVALSSVTTDVTGAQFAAGVNFVGRNVTGAQFAAGANMVSGNFTGAQFSSVANIVEGDFKGFQSGSFNVAAGEFVGVQSGVVNYTGNFTGARFGVVNYGKNLYGADFGIVNIGDDVSGLQMGVVNVDNAAPSATIGVVNVSNTAGGLQLGVVNVTREAHGLQLGVVNVADTNDGIPIGLVTVVLNGGQTHGMAWADERGYCGTAFIHGTQHVYNVYSVGGRIDGERAMAELGLGFSVKFGGFFVNLEGLVGNTYETDRHSRYVFRESAEMIQRGRIYLGYSFAEHFAVFAGASCNLSFDVHEADTEDEHLEFSKVWPGFFVGVRI